MAKLMSKNQRAPNPRHFAYVEEYCTGAVSGKPFNRYRAALAAGYAPSSAQQHSVHLMKMPHIQEMIAIRMKELHMSKEEVLTQITNIARDADISSVLRIKETQLPGSDDKTPGPVLRRLDIDPDAVLANGHLIKSFKYDSNGNPSVELHDRHSALRDIGKAHGLFKDGVELSGPNGGAIPVEMTFKFVRPPSPNDLPLVDTNLIESGE